MSVTLHEDFATPADTAKALGVSPARLRRILRLVGAETAAPEEKRRKNGAKRLQLAERKKQTRGKGKKATR
jgi:hypothetical protein